MYSFAVVGLVLFNENFGNVVFAVFGKQTRFIKENDLNIFYNPFNLQV